MAVPSARGRATIEGRAPGYNRQSTASGGAQEEDILRDGVAHLFSRTEHRTHDFPDDSQPASDRLACLYRRLHRRHFDRAPRVVRQVHRPADRQRARGAEELRLAAGTRIDAALTDTISSRHGRAGNAFTARVVEDVRSSGGSVAIPAGSTVQGTIVEVSPAPNTRSTGTLTLAVTTVTVRGRAYDLDASIDSLDTISKGRGVEGVDAARVGAGAAAGAILGQVIGGNTKGAVIGGVAGGAAGAAVSVIMKDVDIVLPAGSHLMLTLRQRLTVMAN